MTLGCSYEERESRAHFHVWAPRVESLELVFADGRHDTIPMSPRENGYWSVEIDNVRPGMRYWYRLNRTVLRPDPASHAQPDGVHGPSQVVAHRSFRWKDRSWKGLPLDRLVIYELHVGTFTPEGTFDAIIPRLSELRSLGITAIELMPVAPFPGHRNWGYDGAHPFAVQGTYGGPEGLKRLVDACHRTGLAVILDVVYNHLGPEGNYLGEYAPYFTDRYQTPWGMAINYDGPSCNEVRTYFIQNAIHWLDRYHIDGLRLDAVHAIFDQNAIPFLRQLSEDVETFRNRTGRHLHLIAESDLNDPRMIRPPGLGGFGMDAQWSDDFHHSVHALLTGERAGYYADFGQLHHVATSVREGFVYAGQYSPYRQRSHGDTVLDRDPRQLVIACQTHDQVGNRKHGERLSVLVPFEALKTCRALHLLIPYVPLLFMGEEYAEEHPFLYFVSHTDPSLIEAVRKGRKEEFATFEWGDEPPDPQAPETFVRSTIAWDSRTLGHHRAMLDYTKRLLALRRIIPALRNLTREGMSVTARNRQSLIVVHRRWRRSQAVIMCNFGTQSCSGRAHLPSGVWKRALDSSDLLWGGPGSSLPETVRTSDRLPLNPNSAALFLR